MIVPSAAPAADEAEIEAVAAVLRSGGLANGPQARRLENLFAAVCGVPHSVAVASGTDALYMAGRCAGIGPGSTVLVAGFTFAASANAFLSLGAEVVPVDVDIATLNMSAEALADALDARPEASLVVPVDLFGSTAGLGDVIRLARSRGLRVVEDACQAHGARCDDGSPLGSRADFTTFSLYATKNVAAGEGGIVFAREEEDDLTLRLLRNHGSADQYVHQVVGLNHRLPEVAAVLARMRLEQLPTANARRVANARLLAGWCSEAWPGAVMPRIPDDGTHVVHQFTVVVPEPGLRDATVERLRALGVDARVFYPYTLAELPKVRPAPLPAAEYLRARVLSLPVHPKLTVAQLDSLEGAVFAAGREIWSG